MLSHGYPPTISGVSLVVQKISRALVQKGHTIRVVTASERGKPYRMDDQGVEVIRIRGVLNPFWREGPYPAIGLGELRGIIADFKPQVIHTHENVFFSNQLLRLREELSQPLVSSCYFLPRYVTHYLRFGTAINRLIQEVIWRYIIRNLNRYDHTVFSTRTQMQDFIDHGLRVPALAISNGVDSGRYHPANGLVTSVEERYRLPPRPRVLFVGRLMKDKRIDLLVQAMAQVKDEVPAHLLVIGRGAEQAELERLSAELGVADRVHLLGFVPEADLPEIYRACDLFSIASICEVQSIPALQAAVTGLPMVAVNAAALPELVHEERNGHLVPPEDPQALAWAMADILRDRERMREYGLASLKIGQEHAEEETFRRYERFYQSLVGG